MAVPDNLTTRDGHVDRADRKPTPRSRMIPLGLREWTVVTNLSAAQLLLVGLAVSSVNTPSQLLTLAILAPMPIVIGVAAASVTSAWQPSDRAVDLDELKSLVSRVEMAEAIVARDQERLHELRTTVSSVALADRMLVERGGTLPGATRRRLERLSETALARVERLLADTPKDPVGHVELARVLDPVVDALRLRGHAVRWEGSRCTALGRPDDIADVAHILLDNAARHAGGHQIEVAVASTGSWIELRVSDAGPGVPPALAPVVFERGTRSAGSDGEGIGLHIARRIALALGGDLRLETTAAATGAVFVLHLPVSTGDEPCLATA